MMISTFAVTQAASSEMRAGIDGEDGAMSDERLAALIAEERARLARERDMERESYDMHRAQVTGAFLQELQGSIEKLRELKDKETRLVEKDMQKQGAVAAGDRQFRRFAEEHILEGTRPAYLSEETWVELLQERYGKK